MDAATIIWAMFGVICALVSVIYWLLRRDIDRLAKNLHQLRSETSPLTLWVAVIREKLNL